MLTSKAFSGRIILYFILILVIISNTSCTSVSNEKASIQSIPVSVIHVKKGSIQNITTYTGLIKPKKLAYVASAIPGKVLKSYLEVGDRVKKGDILFTLDETEIEEGIRALEEQLKVAEANVSMAETGVISASGSQYESQRIQLEAALKSAENSYIAAKSAFDDATLLMEAGYITRLQYNQARYQYNQAAAALESATNGYELYTSKLAEDNESIADDRLKQAEASYEALKVQLESARKKLELTQITSPMDGIIASKDITEGCLISNTMVPYVVMDSDTVEAVFQVTEKVIGRIKKGDELTLSIPAFEENSIKGTVSTVSPAVDQKTLTYMISIDIKNNKNKIKPGMTAKVGIPEEEHENSIIIPLSAVLTNEGSDFVYIVKENTAEKVPVTTGIIDGDRVEILEGLNEGDVLVVKGHQFLRQNDTVKVTGEGD